MTPLKLASPQVYYALHLQKKCEVPFPVLLMILSMCSMDYEVDDDIQLSIAHLRLMRFRSEFLFPYVFLLPF